MIIVTYVSTFHFSYLCYVFSILTLCYAYMEMSLGLMPMLYLISNQMVVQLYYKFFTLMDASAIECSCSM